MGGPKSTAAKIECLPTYGGRPTLLWLTAYHTAVGVTPVITFKTIGLVIRDVVSCDTGYDIVRYRVNDKPSECCAVVGDEGDTLLTPVSVVLPSAWSSHEPSSSANIRSTSRSFCCAAKLRGFTSGASNTERLTCKEAKSVSRSQRVSMRWRMNAYTCVHSQAYTELTDYHV